MNKHIIKMISRKQYKRKNKKKNNRIMKTINNHYMIIKA